MYLENNIKSVFVKALNYRSRARPTRLVRLSLVSGELGPIRNSAWSIFWRIRIACLEDSVHPSGELGLSPSELGLLVPQFYYKITYQYMNLLESIRINLKLYIGLYKLFNSKSRQNSPNVGPNSPGLRAEFSHDVGQILQGR